ncbi:MAG: DUF4373 domain-containing protein [Sphingobacteriales bacterium]|nr:MAG: DUF4373 domain-containing protein [Sphingobacteriales bacterium]
MPRTRTLRHRTDARHNERIAALVGDHGPAGYGAYWMILEIMHREEGMRIEHSRPRMRRLAAQVGIDATEFARLLQGMIEIYELFAVDENYLVSTIGYTRHSKQVLPQQPIERASATHPELPAPKEDMVIEPATDSPVRAQDIHNWLNRTISRRAPAAVRSLLPLSIAESVYIYKHYDDEPVFAAIDQLQADTALHNHGGNMYNAIRKLLDG